MNLSKLFETQKRLDTAIIEKKELEGRDLLPEKNLALQVELGELANEWRGFKFWSENQSARDEMYSSCPDDKAEYFFCGVGHEKFTVEEVSAKGDYCDEHDTCLMGMRIRNPLLEEYVDCLHFILSIGLELPINIKGLEEFSVFDTYPERTVIFIFNKLFKEIGYIPDENEDEALGSYYNSFQWLLELGFKLSFTWEQIEQAYYDKNEINHTRQDNGY